MREIHVRFDDHELTFSSRGGRMAVDHTAGLSPLELTHMSATVAARNEASHAPRRRDFLRVLGSGAIGLAAVPVLPRTALGRDVAGVPARSATPDEAYWRLVRAQFPLRPGVRPMNAANLCPSPRSVIDRVAATSSELEADVSFQNRAQYDALRERVRARLAAYLGVDADEIAIVRNTSEANNVIAGGVQLGRGDEVVLHSENHPTNAVSWDVRAARYGFAVRRVTVTPEMSADAMLASFRAALTPRTRVLSFTDISNVTGVRLPARALCALARERGIHAHVDGAQSFGAVRLDLRELGCDSYATSAHKWFMGPKEAGVLFVRAERAAAIWPATVGVGWGDTAETSLRAARRFETLGQRNDATIAGLDAALDFHETIGGATIEARVLALATALKELLARIPGARLVTPVAPEQSGGVVIARFGERDHRALYQRLYAEHGVAGAATGGLRLCPHIYNTLDDVAHAAEAVRKLVAEPA
jgi:isopenicillin-N epimerase